MGRNGIQTERRRKKDASLLTRYKDVKCHDDVQSSSRERIESRRIFSKFGDIDTPSTSTPCSSSSTSTSKIAAAGKLKATVKFERDKKINESFSASVKRKAESLGIQIKPKKDKVPEQPNLPAKPLPLIEYSSSDSD